MTQINWGMLPNNSFQNALGMGIQMGQEARARQDQKEQRNALAAYVTNPTAETEAAVAPYAPELVLQGRQQRIDADRQQQAEQQRQMGTFRQLLSKAAQSPEGWAQALGAAQQLGIDTSTIPQQYDPQWAQTQLFIMDALSDPGKLTAIQQDVQSLGIDPGTPEGKAAVGELILFKYGKPTTDELGRAALSLPQISVPGGGQPQAPAMQAQPMAAAGGEYTFEQVVGALQSLGPQGTADWIRRNGITVRVNSPQEAAQLPSGTRYIDPNGVMRVIE